jgi:hypothetical protein
MTNLQEKDERSCFFRVNKNLTALYYTKALFPDDLFIAKLLSHDFKKFQFYCQPRKQFLLLPTIITEQNGFLPKHLQFLRPSWQFF